MFFSPSPQKNISDFYNYYCLDLDRRLVCGPLTSVTAKEVIIIKYTWGKRQWNLSKVNQIDQKVIFVEGGTRSACFNEYFLVTTTHVSNA